MPLYWLCYRHHNSISVVIEPGASLIHARMRAALAGLDKPLGPSANTTSELDTRKNMKMPQPS
jgi:hypothetical protein